MTQPMASKGKRALSSDGQVEEVKTASGAFQRVELQWKDVNYSVREGRGKKAVAKNVRGSMQISGCEERDRSKWVAAN